VRGWLFFAVRVWLCGCALLTAWKVVRDCAWLAAWLACLCVAGCALLAVLGCAWLAMRGSLAWLCEALRGSPWLAGCPWLALLAALRCAWLAVRGRLSVALRGRLCVAARLFTSGCAWLDVL
jgi:biotin transporter BioY